jgi:hypothetical protein
MSEFMDIGGGGVLEERRKRRKKRGMEETQAEREESQGSECRHRKAQIHGSRDEWRNG